MYLPKITKPADTILKAGGTAVLVWGMDGSGKSHFAINTADVAPHMTYLNMDRDVSHLLAKYKGEDYVYEKFRADASRELAAAQCSKVEDMIDWACKQKEPGVFVVDNLVNWRELSNNAYLPETSDPIPRDYERSNNYLRRCALKLEASRLYVVFTAPAGQKWIGEQKKAQELKGEDLLECKAWDGFDFCVTTKVYLFNPGDKRLLRPIPEEDPSPIQFKGYIQRAKLRPRAQGLVLDNPRLKEVLEKVQ